MNHRRKQKKQREQIAEQVAKRLQDPKQTIFVDKMFAADFAFSSDELALTTIEDPVRKIIDRAAAEMADAIDREALAMYMGGACPTSQQGAKRPAKK